MFCAILWCFYQRDNSFRVTFELSGIYAAAVGGVVEGIKRAMRGINAMRRNCRVFMIRRRIVVGGQSDQQHNNIEDNSVDVLYTRTLSFYYSYCSYYYNSCCSMRSRGK